jgi:uncharacterized membrane protein
MKRYVTLDFLRGFAIWLMLVLHIISKILDVDALLSQLETIPLINIVALLVLPFLGGFAGLFLLVSSISNMISMNSALLKGAKPSDLLLKQVVGEFILLIFAALSEGILNHNAVLGMWIRLNPDPWSFANRWVHMETLHTIA